MIVILILTHIAAFVAGALVFRNNTAAANNGIAEVEKAAADAASKVKEL